MNIRVILSAVKMAQPPYIPFSATPPPEENPFSFITPQMMGAAFRMVGPVMNMMKAVNEAVTEQQRTTTTVPVPPPEEKHVTPPVIVTPKEVADFMTWEAPSKPVVCPSTNSSKRSPSKAAMNSSSIVEDDITVLRKEGGSFIDTVVESGGEEYMYTFRRVEKGSGAELASRVVSSPERLSPDAIKDGYLRWAERIKSSVITL